MKKILKYIFGFSFLLLIIFIVTLSIILEPNIKINNWESLNTEKLTKIEHTITLLDDEDNIINSQIYDNNKIFTSFQSVPQHTIDAFISIEDNHFYSHNGIDYLRICSAAIKNIMSWSYKEGASTISQQLIKNTHLTNDKKMSRKLQELRIARDLERNFSKDEILEMYFNMLYFGSNIYGIGTAAKVMFNKNVENLTIEEGALLAAIINNPNKFSPYQNPDNALKRRNLVLKQMQLNKKISQVEYENAISKNLNIQYAKDQNRQYINNIIKEAAEKLSCDEKDLFKKQLVIRTNLNMRMQNKISSILYASVIPKNVIAEIMVINNLSGDVSSICSNADMNLAYTKRQPGSTIKPIIAYAPALEKNIIVPITPILDAPVKFGSYTPSNYKNKYSGWTTAKNSLATSSNSCAIKLLDMNGIKYSKACAAKMGIAFSKNDNTLALALGGMSEGVTLKDITNAYQVFANDGNYIKSSLIKSISTLDGKILFGRKITEKRAINSETAYFINDMLKECVKSGTAKQLKGLENVCAKTGTVGDNNGNSDAYCVVYNGDYSVGVWLGSINSNFKHNLTGGGYAAAIARKVMLDLSDKNSTNFKTPNTIIEVDIDSNELINNHKIVYANSAIPEKYKIKAKFTEKNAPRNYLGNISKINFDSKNNDQINESDFDKFQII